jgi:hypothetical protein
MSSIPNSSASALPRCRYRRPRTRLAGRDCGFGTFAGYGKVDPDIAFKKLPAMAEGARIATRRLSQ